MALACMSSTSAGDTLRAASGARRRRRGCQGRLDSQFAEFDPVRLLQEVRLAQPTLSEFAAHGTHGDAVPQRALEVGAFLRASHRSGRRTRPVRRIARNLQPGTGGAPGPIRLPLHGLSSKAG